MTRRTLLGGAIAAFFFPAKGLAKYLNDRQKVALHGPPARAKEIAQELDIDYLNTHVFDAESERCRWCGVHLESDAAILCCEKLPQQLRTEKELAVRLENAFWNTSTNTDGTYGLSYWMTA